MDASWEDLKGFIYKFLKEYDDECRHNGANWWAAADIGLIYFQLEHNGFADALYLVGIEKTAIQANIHDIKEAMDKNDGNMPYPYAFYALQELVEEGLVERDESGLRYRYVG